MKGKKKIVFVSQYYLLSRKVKVLALLNNSPLAHTRRKTLCKPTGAVESKNCCLKLANYFYNNKSIRNTRHSNTHYTRKCMSHEWDWNEPSAWSLVIFFFFFLCVAKLRVIAL